MDKCLIAREISYTDGQRRFRTLFDRCDTCGEMFTEHTLKMVANEIGGDATDDNIVSSCASCFSIDADPVVKVAEFLDYLAAMAAVNVGPSCRG